MKTPYLDIIHLSRPVSSRPAMSMHDRAAQFSSFAALNGYEDAVAESGRRTETKYELDEAEKAELNRELCRLLAFSAESAPQVSVTFFVPDERKSGGNYCTATGQILKLKRDSQTLEMADGTQIPISEICAVKTQGTETDLP